MLGFATDSSSGTSMTQWIDWFTAQKQSKLYCYVDHDYMTDRFNLTGLQNYSQNIMECIQIMTDQVDDDSLEKECSHVYGLIHARYIMSRFGLHKMCEKYRKREFGICPRLTCLTAVLPIGVSDQPNVDSVKLYCPNCDDIYNSELFKDIDGCHFGTSFPMMLMLSYSDIFATYFDQQKEIKKSSIKLYGFNVHPHKLKRKLEGVASK